MMSTHENGFEQRMLAALFFAASPESRFEFCGEVIGHLNGREIHAALRYEAQSPAPSGRETAR
jgi:hypothetical protein